MITNTKKDLFSTSLAPLSRPARFRSKQRRLIENGKSIYSPRFIDEYEISFKPHRKIIRLRSRRKREWNVL